MALFAVVLAPISEELLFRGCLCRFLKSQTNISFAFLISGACLPSCTQLGDLYATILGILLAYLYERR